MLFWPIGRLEVVNVANAVSPFAVCWFAKTWAVPSGVFPLKNVTEPDGK
jgi:hypothetical protein